MRSVRVVVVGLLVVVLLAVVGGLGVVAWLTARAQPPMTGDLRVPGLTAPATVQRDVRGLAWITAESPHDLFFAQGWLHASERMWQMEIWRHIGAGRLAAAFGESQIATDRFIRTLGWRQAAERDLAAQSPEVRATLEAYANGVNAWLDANRGSLGVPYLVSGVDPAPWTPLDTLLWGKVQAWNLGGNMEVELFRYLADAQLGDPARTDELFPTRSGPVITPTGLPGSGGSGADIEPPAEGGARPPAPGTSPRLTTAQAAGWRAVASAANRALRTAGLDGGDALASDHGIGSNGWVVAPGRSVTGGALLANDPHLGISMPSIWYVNGLRCATVSAACPYDVVGVSFPGVPGVVLGHNARIAWGATNVDPDVQDLVIETADPADPNRYIGPEGVSRPFEVRTETIEVAGGSPVTLEVRSTSHGPILNGVDDRLEGAPLMALRWTGTHPDIGPDRTLEAFLGLNVAHDLATFRETLRGYVAPSQNLVYADVDGHIGYQLPGAIPVRSDPEDRGLRPVRGDDGSGEWTGLLPFDDLPRQLDPIDGWIVTANNAAVDESWPDFIGAEWDPGYRAERIIDLVNLLSEDGLTTDEMAEIQVDTAPLRARDVAFLLGEAEPATDEGRVIATRIGEWDGICTTDSRGCAAYQVWEYRLLRAIFDDELGSLARDYVGSPYSWVALEGLLQEPGAAWWDDVTTPEVETADAVILAALDAAGGELAASLGSPDRWTWGALHTASFEEDTVGQSGIGPLEWYMNAGAFPVDGAAGAINNTYYRLSRGYPDPDDPDAEPADVTELFTVTNLPSYRLVIDMADLDGAGIVITTGQGGNPFGRHIGDQIEVWQQGDLLPLPFTRDAVQAATVATLRLTP
jgi:penicillin amidase